QGFGPTGQNAWRGSQALSPEARSYPVPPGRGSADGARSGQPAFPQAETAWGPRPFYLLGRSESARHQGFGPTGQNAWRGSQALSPEARSYPVPPGRG